MVRVEVKNFQSIAHEVVEIDGFSALVGRSNIGKSAVVRAIKAALTGAPADNYVRHDELCLRLVKGAKTCKCFCSVHIVAEGLDLLWEKGDAINRYVHNTVVHTVVGKGTPDFLTDGFSLVKIGDDKELLQVSDQFNPIFILNESGTVVADVLSDVAKLDEINVAMRLVEKDRKEATSTRKVRDKDILDLRSAMVRYEGFDDALGKVLAVESSDRLVEETTQRLEKLDAFVESALAVARKVKGLEQIGAVNVPEIEAVVQGGARYKTLGAFEIELGAKDRAVSALNGVEAVVPPDITAFTQLGSMYQQLKGWAEKLDGLRSYFERTQKVTAVEPPAFDGVVQAQAAYVKVQSLVDRANAVVKASSELQASLETATQAEAAVMAEFKALGVCPTCHREFAVDHQHGVT